MRQQQIEQLLQVVGTRYWQAQFLQQGFAVFFSGLLTMKADDVINSQLFGVELLCSEPVRFGFSDPRRGFLLHGEQLLFP